MRGVTHAAVALPDNVLPSGSTPSCRAGGRDRPPISEPGSRPWPLRPADVDCQRGVGRASTSDHATAIGRTGRGSTPPPRPLTIAPATTTVNPLRGFPFGAEAPTVTAAPSDATARVRGEGCSTSRGEAGAARRPRRHAARRPERSPTSSSHDRRGPCPIFGSRRAESRRAPLAGRRPCGTCRRSHRPLDLAQRFHHRSIVQSSDSDQPARLSTVDLERGELGRETSAPDEGLDRQLPSCSCA